MPQAEPRTFQDADAIRDGRVDFADPLERAAIAMHRMTFATPEDVASLLNGGDHRRDELAYTWRRLAPHERHLWRRRAAVILAVAGATQAPPA
jgi:hypothetical protein